jgi:hypothetical protein
VRLTRRELVAAAAAGAVGAAGVYELVDHLASSPARPTVGPRPREQHVLEGVRMVEDHGIEVLVPPLHHQVITGRLTVPERADPLAAAARELEDTVLRLEADHEPTPAGLGVTVAWGLPYFRRYTGSAARAHLPTDLRASRTKGRRVRALTDAIRFPSDPDGVVLEDNDIALLVRSDDRGAVEDAGTKLLALELFRPTSIRKGFAGGGFEGRRSLPKRMALAAGVPGAELIPDTAELFLGFTSTQRAGLGPHRIANFETLGYTDAGGGYFEGGTHMALSHIFEDLEAWYLNFDFSERVETTFRPRLDVKPGTQTVRQAPADVSTEKQVRAEFDRSRRMGHSAGIQTTSRLLGDVVGTDGTRYEKGTAVPQRADFNTLDNPFFWSADRVRDGWSDTPAAGLHFVVFNPSSDDFHRNRLAMDGVLPDGPRLPFPPRDRGQGLNSVLQTTHRQNFLVPPRAHRSFPLSELL